MRKNDAREGDAYAVDVTRSAKASWERRRMEAIRRWGSLKRLSAKASPESALKFEKAREKYLAATESRDPFELARRCGVMERGVDALEREALERGACSSDLVWFDLGMRVNGKRAVCVLSASDAEYVACTLTEELEDDVIVYTAADIVLMANENPTALTHLKHVFSAYTTEVHTREQGEAPW
jgi:hypothetical protein